jgi:hypothetical protein
MILVAEAISGVSHFASVVPGRAEDTFSRGMAHFLKAFRAKSKVDDVLNEIGISSGDESGFVVRDEMLGSQITMKEPSPRSACPRVPSW